MVERVQTKAPGKLILAGEHAVVHGCPALVVAADRFAYCTLERRRDGRVVFGDSPFCGGVEADADELRALHRGMLTDYERFQRGELLISDVVRRSEMLLLFAVAVALDGRPLGGGFGITLQTDIPVCCGMGSSAAVAAAVIDAVLQAQEVPVTREQLFEMVMACERMQHGNPSGVDAYASIYGGALRYRKGGEIEPLKLAVSCFELVHTGVPLASTGECVSAVREAFADTALTARFEEAVRAVELALRQGQGGGRSVPLRRGGRKPERDAPGTMPLLNPERDAPGTLQGPGAGRSGHHPGTLVAGIRRNHRLLVEIGVVPGRVARFIAEIESIGGAGKICGAGSVKGEAGGMVWVVGVEQAARNALVQRYGYELMQLN
jgi:mevalonate kinase